MENITTTCTTTIPQEIPPAFSRQTSDFGDAAGNKESSAVSRRPRRQERYWRKRTHNNAKKIKGEINCTHLSGSSSSSENDNNDEEENDDDDDDENVAVEEKIMALQRIVPGGESLGADKLFEETADYILALQFQVKALKFLTTFVEGSEKERRKLGG